MERYYVYRWTGIGCTEAVQLGVFETDRPLHKVWDLMLQIFCSDGGGMFVRKEMI